MGKVVDIDCVTSLPLNPQRVLQRALEKDLERVMIVGFDQEGNEYFAASNPSGPENLWMLARAQKALLTIADNGGFIDG